MTTWPTFPVPSCQLSEGKCSMRILVLHIPAGFGKRQSCTVWYEDRVETKPARTDRKSTRLNSSHVRISYAVFCLKKTKTRTFSHRPTSVTTAYVTCILTAHR